MSIDYNKAGSYPARLKIKKAPEFSGEAKIGNVEVEGAEPRTKIALFADAKFRDRLVEGAEDDAEICVKESKNGDGSMFVWLNAFGPKEPKGGGGRGRGGGGNWSPKEFYAEVAPSVGGIYNHGIDKGLALSEIEKHARSYVAFMQDVRAQNPAPVQAPAETDDRREAVKAFAVSLFGADAKALEEFKAYLKVKGLEYQSTMINAQAAGVKTKEALTRFVEGGHKSSEAANGAS